MRSRIGGAVIACIARMERKTSFAGDEAEGFESLLIFRLGIFGYQHGLGSRKEVLQKQGRQRSKQAGDGSRQTIEDPAVMFRDVAGRTSKRVTSFT